MYKTLFLLFVLLLSCSRSNKKELDVGDCVGDPSLFFQVVTDINDGEIDSISFWFKKSEGKYFDVQTNFNPHNSNSSNFKIIKCPTKLSDFNEESQYLARKHLHAK